MSGGSGQSSPDIQMMAEAAGVSPDEIKKWQLAHNVQQAFNAVASGFGGGGGGGGQAAAQSFDPRSKLMEIAKLRQMQTQMQQRQQIEASLPQISAQTGVPIEQLRYMNASGNLGSVLQDRSKAPDPYTLSEGQQRYGGNNQLLAQNVQQKPIAPQWSDGQLVGGFNPNTNQFVTPEALGAPVPGPAARPPTEEERKAFGITGPAYFNRAGEPKGIGGGTTVNVDTKAQSAEETGRGTGLAKRMNDLADDGAKAGEDAMLFQRFGDLLGTVQTGKRTETLERVRQMTGLALDPNTDNVQALNAAIQYVAPRLRVPGAGAQSDRELSNFLASIPSLAGSPEGNKQILGTLSGLVDYRRARANIATQWQLGDLSAKDAQKQIDALPSPFAALVKPGADGPVRVQTPEEARKLPKGTPIILPDGRTATVP